MRRRRSSLILRRRCISSPASPSFFFFFNDTATTEIYTLSLHDALPIPVFVRTGRTVWHPWGPTGRDRKSTRLNSSHVAISYAVFCLKKKKPIDYCFSFSIKKQNNNKIIK